jgi:hypothetical protein
MPAEAGIQAFFPIKTNFLDATSLPPAKNTLALRLA